MPCGFVCMSFFSLQHCPQGPLFIPLGCLLSQSPEGQVWSPGGCGLSDLICTAVHNRARRQPAVSPGGLWVPHCYICGVRFSGSLLHGRSCLYPQLVGVGIPGASPVDSGSSSLHPLVPGMLMPTDSLSHSGTREARGTAPGMSFDRISQRGCFPGFTLLQLLYPHPFTEGLQVEGIILGHGRRKK